MKAFCSALVVFGLATLIAPRSSAQEIRTIEACRSYREAWYTTADADTKHLSATVLMRRADQMETCGKEIDSKPFTAQMTQKEALDVSIADIGYAALALAYKEEALNRVLWFIGNKRLTKAFITDDEQGKVAKPTR